LGFFSALETARRPRGASRASSAPTSVSGQLCLCHCLDRLDCPPGDWVRAARCMAWVSPAPLRPRAARAALREQARSYICFRPVMSGGLPGPPWLFAWRLGQGRQAHAFVFSAPSRPCAARAALPGQARSHICFGPVMSVPSPRPLCVTDSYLRDDFVLYYVPCKYIQKLVIVLDFMSYLTYLIIWDYQMSSRF